MFRCSLRDFLRFYADRLSFSLQDFFRSPTDVTAAKKGFI